MSAPIPSKLQEEIRQRLPFASLQNEAILSILRTADVLRRSASRFFEPFGITQQQFNVLRILRGAGACGLPTLDISERMIEQAPGITRMIDRLEIKKLVSRERGCDDRRQVVCKITNEGLELLARLDEPTRELSVTSMEGIADEDLKTLVRVLDDIRGAYSE